MTGDLVADGWLRRKLTTVTVSKLRYSRDSVPLYAADNPAIKALVDCLKECADDLEGELKERYSDALLAYSGERKKYERDMAPVVAARAALAPWVAKETK